MTQTPRLQGPASNEPKARRLRAGQTTRRGDHHLVGALLAHAELGLEHHDDEVARRVVVIDQDDLVQPRPFQLRFRRGFRFDGRIDYTGFDTRKNGLDFGKKIGIT